MSTLIDSVLYFDSDQREFVEGSVLIEDGRITALDEIKEADTVINGNGKYLLPGLIDAHIHFFQSAGLFTRPDGLDLRHIKSYEQETADIRANIPQLFKRYLATGVTGIVDCGGPFWNFEIREQSKQTEFSPEVDVAGPLVSTVSREKLDLGDAPIIKADNEKHARKLVRDCIEEDPVFVKLWFIYQEDRFDEDSKIMKASIEETHELGYRVAVHATERETAKRAVLYGADILVHSVFNEPVDDEFINLMIEQDVLYIPTIMVRNGYRDVYRTRLFLTDFEQKWGDPSVIRSFEKLINLTAEEIPESHRNLRDEYDEEPSDTTSVAYTNLVKLHDAGVRIATGTDAGNVGTLHGPSLHTEMQYMVNAGMDPADVIISTTKHAASVLGQDHIGVIEVGNQADLVILNHNPLENIKHTQDIEHVIRQGRIYQPDDLITPFDPVSLIDGQLIAYNNRDIDSFLSYYHPRIKILDQETGEILMEGLGEMRQRYKNLFDNSPNLNATIVNRIALGSYIVDYEEVTGHLGRDLISAIAYYEVKHQKITRVWFAN